VEHNPSAGEAHIRVDRTLESPTRGSSASTSPFDAYAQPSTKASATFRENAERAEKLARALSATIKGEIDRLKGERRNDPERQAEIDFLEFVSTTLDQIAAAIGAARQAVAPRPLPPHLPRCETRPGRRLLCASPRGRDASK
jgi:hypothetical protein